MRAHSLGAVIGVLAAAGFGMGPARAAAGAGHWVRAGALALRVSAQGEVIGTVRGSGGAARMFRLESRLPGFSPESPPRVASAPGGGVRLAWQLRHSDGRRCALTERFQPTASSVRWSIEVTSAGSPWSAPIQTYLVWGQPKRARFWTAWGDGRPVVHVADWQDPLAPQPLARRTLIYGGADHTRADAFSIPLASIVEPACGVGLSLVLSPEDRTLDMTLTTSPGGSVVFERRNRRLGEGHSARYAMDLVAHPADWRGGLQWMVRRYPGYFEPPNPRTHAIAGLGAYSWYEGELDAARLLAVGFRVNWKASFDFPYMGMFLPPVGEDDEWTSFRRTPTSIRRLRDYSRRMRSQGFSVLNYFNVTEFGAYTAVPAPPRKAKRDADLWRDSNDFLYYRLGQAIVPGPDGRPIGSWEGCVAMDPGEPAYQRFLLDQARRHLEKIPDSDGICIDRLDWLRCYHLRADDGLSWVNGRPARSLLSSWHDLMGRLGPLMHRADKVIYCNPLNRRLDLMQHIDGIYDEMADQPQSLNLCALLGLRRPVIGWTASVASLRPDPDAVFQRCLHLGVFPTAPLPGNDHTITPDPWAERYYQDYGPLMQALRGRLWVLQPGVVTVVGGTARANVFAVPGGFVVPVTGGQSRTIDLILRHLPVLPGQQGFRVDALHPGGGWVPLRAVSRNGSIAVRVPLRRGCAMVRLRHTWVLPSATGFSTAVDVILGTTLRGVHLRYTLDGSEPTAHSRCFARPIRVRRTTVVRVAPYRGDRQAGPVVWANFVRVPPAAPLVRPARAIFRDTVSVTLQPSLPVPGGVVHYTLDGAEPASASPRYEGPIVVRDTTRLKARVLAVGALPGRVAEADFVKLPPVPPMPDVHLSDLQPLRSTVGWGGAPKMDRSIEGRPLCLAGTLYAKGVGVHAASELVYPIRPEYRAFVAIVGIDHEMKAWNPASVVFRVLVDGKPVAESPLVRQGDVWHFHVPLPPGGREVALVADDAGDGIHCDHADWVNAGFLVRQPE